MKQLEIENQLRDVVSRLIAQVELATSQGRTDINLALEDAFIPILKSVFNLPHLINLNRKRKNYPGIDLGDDHDRVAFQITSTVTLDKVKGTLEQFMERQYFNTFDEVFVMMLVKKQASYSQTSVNSVLDERFAFNVKKHVIDLGDVLGMVTGLRLAAQERVLADFKQILGDVDAYLSFNEENVEAPATLTSNLQEIELPTDVYIGELSIDEKVVTARAKKELGYRGRARSTKAIVKMALLLEGMDTDSWVFHDGRLFSFRDPDTSGLSSILDEGTIETLSAGDLIDSGQIDNINIMKQLLFAETHERLSSCNVKLHPKDRFFYFCSNSEEPTTRYESWVGKKTATRRVYEVKYQKKDPSKVAHHKHFSFELSFVDISGTWFAQIRPSWYFSYNGHTRSNWHDDLLSQQKRLELNASVRNMVRFTAFYLANLPDEASVGLDFRSLIVFSNDDDEPNEDEAELFEDTEEETAA
ncbi:SMEK domain-containing protein [Nereida sp. MMG025]|uniref:SMEK domain-containing protein n=1 Tax=Nereida sp. MMG025 TaxID=2909981 RepID=UPI001F17F916|nr:SMEK domain-containing protein [Nereida sp. MMG025]MCF6445681.1 SMEK domain-containing protein [Nereida sp. MMG025]